MVWCDVVWYEVVCSQDDFAVLCCFGLSPAVLSCFVVLCGLLNFLWCGVVWCGVVWCGVVWCGVVWCGVVWCGVVWCGVVWCGVVWCGVPWCGVVCRGAARSRRYVAPQSLRSTFHGVFLGLVLEVYYEVL